MFIIAASKATILLNEKARDFASSAAWLYVLKLNEDHVFVVDQVEMIRRLNIELCLWEIHNVCEYAYHETQYNLLYRQVWMTQNKE